MSDAAFINTYNEIMFENFVAVLKQNFLFQTQLKVLEGRVAQLQGLEQQVTQATNAVSELAALQITTDQLRQEVAQRTAELTHYQQREAEHHRIQTALNDTMRECDALKQQLAQVTSLPRPSKKRKINTAEDNQPMTTLLNGTF